MLDCSFELIFSVLTPHECHRNSTSRTLPSRRRGKIIRHRIRLNKAVPGLKYSCLFLVQTFHVRQTWKAGSQNWKVTTAPTVLSCKRIVGVAHTHTPTLYTSAYSWYGSKRTTLLLVFMNYDAKERPRQFLERDWTSYRAMSFAVFRPKNVKLKRR